MQDKKYCLLSELYQGLKNYYEDTAPIPGGKEISGSELISAGLQRFIVVSVRDTASTGTHNRYGTTQPREHYSTAPCWPLMHS